jgi:hypothetical protein
MCPVVSSHLHAARQSQCVTLHSHILTQPCPVSPPLNAHTRLSLATRHSTRAVHTSGAHARAARRTGATREALPPQALWSSQPATLHFSSSLWLNAPKHGESGHACSVPMDRWRSADRLGSGAPFLVSITVLRAGHPLTHHTFRATRPKPARFDVRSISPRLSLCATNRAAQPTPSWAYTPRPVALSRANNLTQLARATRGAGRRGYRHSLGSSGSRNFGSPRRSGRRA